MSSPPYGSQLYEELVDELLRYKALYFTERCRTAPWRRTDDGFARRERITEDELMQGTRGLCPLVLLALAKPR